VNVEGKIIRVRWRRWRLDVTATRWHN